MVEIIIPPYEFHRGRRAILAELHLPKRVKYLSEIYGALKEGLDEELVKEYTPPTQLSETCIPII